MNSLLVLNAKIVNEGTIAEAGKLCLYLAADATFTTGVDHVISGGAELGYGVKGYTDAFGKK